MAQKQTSRVPADMTVGFIGAGRMAQAMARGFISTGCVKESPAKILEERPNYIAVASASIRAFLESLLPVLRTIFIPSHWLLSLCKGESAGIIKPMNITASDPDPRMLNFIKQDLGVNVTLSNTEVVEKSDLIVLAVKPNVVQPVLQEVSETVSKEKLLVSIAAGIPLKSIEQYLPENSRVIRVMPNTPALVQAAASVLAPGQGVQDGDTDLVKELLQAIGICEPGSEKLLDAVTGLSGSGPAYAFTAIEALSDGGVKMGLPRDLAMKLAAQTMLGAAKMVLETGKHPGQLKDEVCSPGGTTISAMHKLEKAGFRAALIDAVEAATLKAKELGSANS